MPVTPLLAPALALVFAAPAARGAECSAETLGAALAVDTTRLRRARRTAVPPHASEGAAYTTFYDGRTPRVIHATYYGETGKRTLRYYLQDSAGFVVDSDEEQYARPIYMARRPRVVRRVRSFTYFCNGAPLPAPFAEDVRTFKPTLDTLLLTTRRAR